MKPKLALKNIWRSWVRSVFIFILLAATTCLLFSNVMEYYINRRETGKAIEAFDGIGTMEKGSLDRAAENQSSGSYIFTDTRVPMDYYPDDFVLESRLVDYDSITNDEIEEIEQLPYVTYTDKRYMTSGVSDEYKRLDMDRRDYYDFTNCYVIEATIDKWYETHNILFVNEIEIIGGNRNAKFRYDKFQIIPQSDAPVYKTADGTEVSPDVWISGLGYVTDKCIYNADYCSKLIPGQRYVFVVRMVTSFMDEYPKCYLTDHFTYGWCDGIWSLEGETENYIETEKFAPLREYIRLIETDLYTFDVVYTQNMGAIRYFADGTLGITDGRRLTRQDYLNGNNVCVINHELARVYDLEVGDTITLNLGNKLFEQYEGVGAVAAVPQRLATEYTEVTLEIVGIWKDTRHRIVKSAEPDPCWSYNINTVFVPTHLLNADEQELENHTFAMGEFSFVIENVYDVENFESNHIQTIKRMGFKPILNDGNWKELEETFEESKLMALIKIAILSMAVLAAGMFTVLLYILGRKRDYAIMRVLGTSKKISRNSIMLPLVVITCGAVILGTVIAWIYTVSTISVDLNVSQMAEYTVDKSVPAWLIFACIIAVMTIVLVIAALIITVISRKSPLALIQDKNQQKLKKRKQQLILEPEKVELGQWVSLSKPKHDGKKRGARFVKNYVVRNILRTKTKALLFILVTVLLLNAAGQINVLLDAYTETFDTTEIVSKYAGSLNLDYVSQLQNSGYVKDVFYRARRSVDINMMQTPAYITNDIDRFLNTEADITYLDGYDEGVMQTHENILIMDRVILEEYELKLGDTVYVTNGGKFSERFNTTFSFYRQNNGYDEPDETVIPIIYDECARWYMTQAGEFIIVGSIETGDRVVLEEGEEHDDSYVEKGVYLPGNMELNTAYGKLVVMEITEATLLDNWRTDEYREYGRELADANLTFEVAFMMDTTLVDYLGGVILLLELVAPVAIIAMLVIGIFMTSLIIVQTSKDVAIMRVLGTSKARTRVIIVTERVVLCLIGMIVAVAVMFAMRGVNEIVLKKTAMALSLYFAAILAASCAAAAAVSRKNVLELLQTKE